ncbi:hypothetical protein CVD28_22260 [Bacillus sp. M6-12]|nr:hypothetical protein CVD28_22260 [Bacillus sp. M6-12]
MLLFFYKKPVNKKQLLTLLIKNVIIKFYLTLTEILIILNVEFHHKDPATGKLIPNTKAVRQTGTGFF